MSQWLPHRQPIGALRLGERVHPPIRLFVIGHSYMTRYAQKKFEALGRHGMPYQVLCLVPTSWPDNIFTLSAAKRSGESLRVEAAPVLFAGFGSRYLFLLPEPLRSLRRFRPNIIEIEHEPVALVLVQILFSLYVLRQSPKVVIFCWENIVQQRKFPLTVFARLIERFTLARVDQAIAGNDDAVGVLRRKGFKGPVDVLPQFGLDLLDYAAGTEPALRTKLGLGSSYVVGFAGRIIGEKGLLILAEALCGIKECDWKLLLVGRGDLIQGIRDVLRSAGKESQLTHVDSVPHLELPRYLRCMDVLVLPSLTTPGWKEQFGHVLIEAMACGIPVIGSSSGAIPQVIDRAGLIVPEGDAAQLRSALRTLIGDDVMRDSLISQGRSRVVERYTHDAIARTLDRLYRRLELNLPGRGSAAAGDRR